MKKAYNKYDTLSLMIIGLIVSSFIGIWFFFTFPILINIIISILLGFSLYYQIMTAQRGLSKMTIVMNIEDRILNEIAYQVTKRGYYIKFELKDKSSRPGRNPKTGEEIPISARRVVTFRSGMKLKARVEAYAGTK